MIDTLKGLTSHKSASKIGILLLLFLLSVYVVTSYFNFSTKINGFATFPLDDAWIFWGFSKTFAENGICSINADTPAGAGVTSPAYMLILALFMKLGFTNEFLVNLIFNGILLFFSSLLIYRVIGFEVKDRVIALLLTIIFICLSRTASIANSGMETLLFIFIQILIFYLLQREKFHLVFLFIGIGFWVRPEIAILLPIIPLLYRKRIKAADFLYFILPFFSYFIFFKVFTGNFWVNTGAAKYDFYSYISRWDYLKASFIYLGKTAFPFIPLFFLISLFRQLRKSKFLTAMFSYLLIFWFSFLIYLPVLYHFGRYIFPLVPLLLIIASFSLNSFRAKKYRYPLYIILLLSAVLSVYHLEQGKKIYARECRDFLQRHVKLSLWINENLPEKASIATHDIGAVGYFTGRRIIDIIGLMDKDAVGISKNPQKINAFLNRRKCDYVAVLNSWFVVLNSPLIYETPGPGKADVRFQVYKYTEDTRVIRLDLFENYKKMRDLY